MAIKASYVSLVLLVTLTICNQTTAQSGCTSALVGLSPCLNYVTGNSSTPSSSCCTQLSSIVQSQPQCLCVLLRTDASSLGLAINRTLALAVPRACNVQTPPVSQCDGVNGPGPGPASSPSGSPADEAPEGPSTSSEPDMPSGTGSKTVPTTNGVVVGGSNAGASFSFAGFLVLLASSWVFSGSGSDMWQLAIGYKYNQLL